MVLRGQPNKQAYFKNSTLTIPFEDAENKWSCSV